MLVLLCAWCCSQQRAYAQAATIQPCQDLAARYTLQFTGVSNGCPIPANALNNTPKLPFTWQPDCKLTGWPKTSILGNLAANPQLNASINSGLKELDKLLAITISSAVYDPSSASLRLSISYPGLSLVSDMQGKVVAPGHLEMAISELLPGCKLLASFTRISGGNTTGGWLRGVYASGWVGGWMKGWVGGRVLSGTVLSGTEGRGAG